MQGIGLRIFCCFIVLTLALPLEVMPKNALAQEQAAAKPFKQEELEQLVASIALYPDSVLAQVLMASTYPLEVVEADRWAKKNKNLKDKALTEELEKKSWDPSVKSLVNFPQVLEMMSEKLDWTQKLGDAFLAQQTEVMDAVQRLRKKANDAGNLKSTKEQKVTVEKEPPQVIIIESASPEVIYVPTYNPTVVYGAWPYPAYPPYYYYPPGYVAGTAFMFGMGIAAGAAWGYGWGHCDWDGGDIDINHNQNNNINNNINRDKYKQQFDQNRQQRQGERDQRQGDRQTRRDERQGQRGDRGNSAQQLPSRGDGQRGQGQRGDGSWQHNPEHRKGASYRDQATGQRFNRASTSDAMKSRESFRGRAEAGRQDIGRGGASGFKGGDFSGRGGSFGQGGGRDFSGRGGGGSAFSGMDRGGASTRDFSNRGSSSRASSWGGGGGGSRGGGGGSVSRGGGGGGSRGGGGGGSRGGGGGGSRGGGGGGSRGGGGGGGRR